MPTRVPLLRGGAADLDALIEPDNSSYTVVWVKPDGGEDRLYTGKLGGGHIAHMAHMSPNAAMFPPTESGHVSFPPG